MQSHIIISMEGPFFMLLWATWTSCTARIWKKAEYQLFYAFIDLPAIKEYAETGPRTINTPWFYKQIHDYFSAIILCLLVHPRLNGVSFRDWSKCMFVSYRCFCFVFAWLHWIPICVVTNYRWWIDDDIRLIHQVLDKGNANDILRNSRELHDRVKELHQTHSLHHDSLYQFNTAVYAPYNVQQLLNNENIDNLIGKIDQRGT